jgi:hypothetical protein
MTFRLAAAILIASLQLPWALALAREGAPCAMCSERCCCSPKGQRLASISRCPRGEIAVTPSAPDTPALPIGRGVALSPGLQDMPGRETLAPLPLSGFARPPDRPPRIVA